MREGTGRHVAKELEPPTAYRIAEEETRLERMPNTDIKAW